MCNCRINLEFTVNLYKPHDADLPVYICRNCKKYYILVNFNEIEVKYNYNTDTWEIVERCSVCGDKLLSSEKEIGENLCSACYNDKYKDMEAEE